MSLEQFKDTLPLRVATHVGDQKDIKMALEAAALAVEYVIMLKGVYELRATDEGSLRGFDRGLCQHQGKAGMEHSLPALDRASHLMADTCRDYLGKGHWKSKCSVLNCKSGSQA